MFFTLLNVPEVQLNRFRGCPTSTRLCITQSISFRPLSLAGPAVNLNTARKEPTHGQRSQQRTGSTHRTHSGTEELRHGPAQDFKIGTAIPGHGQHGETPAEYARLLAECGAENEPLPGRNQVPARRLSNE
jgi:hypothetical protein